MSNPSDARRAGSVVLFTNGDTSYEFFRDLGQGRVGERILLAQTRTGQRLGPCVVLKCVPVPQVANLTEKYRCTRASWVDVFINRKHGREPVTFPHPALEPVLKDTYRVIVYQEQVMQISQVLGGNPPRETPRHSPPP